MNQSEPEETRPPKFAECRFASCPTDGERCTGWLAGSTVVKTLNHLGYHELDADRRATGSPERRALGVAGDDPGAVDVVAELAQRIRYDSVSKTRSFAIPAKEPFLRVVGPAGALYVGSPETVAQKIAANLSVLGATRFDLNYGMGSLSHHAFMSAIELYGTRVVPRVRELLVEAEGRGS